MTTLGRKDQGTQLRIKRKNERVCRERSERCHMLNEGTSHGN